MIVQDEYGWQWWVKPIDPAGTLVGQLARLGFTRMALPRSAIYDGVAVTPSTVHESYLISISGVEGTEDALRLLFTLRDCCDALT